VIYLLLATLLSGPAPAAEPPRPTAAQINRRISDAFGEIEKARFGPARSGEMDEKHFDSIYAPANGPFRAKAGSECGTVSVKEKMGPVRTQGSLGWCFAVVAADMLGIEAGKRFSYFDLGMQYFRNSPEDRQKDRYQEPLGDDPSVTKFWAGSIDRAMQIGLRGGLCTEDEVASTDSMVSVLRSPNYPAKPEKINPRHINTEVIRAVELSVGRTMEQMANDAEETCESVMSAQLLVPKLSAWQIIATLSSARTREEAFHWMLQQGCKRRPPRLPEAWKFMTYVAKERPGSSKAADLLPKVDTWLAGGKPVALAFDVKRFHAGAAANPDVKKAPHAAIIVKREFRDGQCKYLVRDSQGPTCAAFAPPYNSAKNCERGHYWISERDFESSVIGVSGVE
jgi:hypothetical protein